MLFQLSIVLHIIGLTFLIGGLLIGLRVARMPTPNPELLKSIRFGYVLSGVFLVLVTGFYQLLNKGMSFYFTQGWFHGKFTAALILVAVAGILFTKFAKVEQSGQPLSRKFTAIMHSVIGVFFIAAVVLVVLGRSGLI